MSNQDQVLDLAKYVNNKKESALQLAKKELKGEINRELYSYSAAFKLLRQNKRKVGDLLDELSERHDVNTGVVHEIINVGKLKLLTHFMTEKERSKDKWTGHAIVTLFTRAAKSKLTEKQVEEILK